MTPQEKWDRLNNPTCLADWGLSLSRDELIQFPEGRAIVEEIDAIKKERQETEKMLKEFANNMSETLDNLIEKNLKEIFIKSR